MNKVTLVRSSGCDEKAAKPFEDSTSFANVRHSLGFGPFSNISTFPSHLQNIETFPGSVVDAVSIHLSIRVKNVLSDNGFYSTTSRTTVPNPVSRLPPRADERLQMVTDNDKGSDYVLVVTI